MKCSMTLGHVTPLVLASHGGSSSTKGTIVFMSRKLRCNMTSFVMWHYWCCHQHQIIPMAWSNDTFAFVRLQWPKWGATWLSWSCDTINTCISITWYQWFYQWHHCKVQHIFGQVTLTLVLASCDPKHHYIHIYIRLRQSKWDATLSFWSCDTLAPVLV